MATPEKEAAVAELKSYIENCSIAIMTQYQGITVAEVTELRAKLRSENVTFKVFKNNLAKIALDELDLSDVVGFMEGPTVWAFCEDPVTPARILKEFSKEVEVLKMRGGVLGVAKGIAIVPAVAQSHVQVAVERTEREPAAVVMSERLDELEQDRLRGRIRRVGVGR